MTSWSQEEDLRLMLEIIGQQTGLKIDWNKIATNMGRTVSALSQHYDILKKKASMPGPSTASNAIAAKKRPAGQATAGSSATKKANSKQARVFETTITATANAAPQKKRVRDHKVKNPKISMPVDRPPAAGTFRTTAAQWAVGSEGWRRRIAGSTLIQDTDEGEDQRVKCTLCRHHGRICRKFKRSVNYRNHSRACGWCLFSGQACRCDEGEEEDKEDEDDEEEDVHDAEAIIPKLVATPKSAKGPHYEAFQNSSAKEAIMEPMETAVIDGDEDDEVGFKSLGRDFYESEGEGTSTGKALGSTKQRDIFDGMIIGGGTEACKRKRAKTGYDDESTLSMSSRQKSRTKYLVDDQEEEEKALKSLGLQREIKEENQEDYDDLYV